MPTSDVKQAQAAVALLIAAGFTAADAVQWIRDAAAMVPEGADSATWLPDPGSLALTAIIDETAVQDARADWYVHAPQEYKLLLDDLAPGAPEAIGLGEAVFFDPAQAAWLDYLARAQAGMLKPDPALQAQIDLYNPNHYPAGSPRGGQFAPGSRATIGMTGEVEPGGASALGGDAADGQWLSAHVKFSGESADDLRNTFTAAGVPQRYFEGVTEITTAAPSNTFLGTVGKSAGRFADRYSSGIYDGEYIPKTHTIHIAPSCVTSQAVAVHELGHHVMFQKDQAPLQRMRDQLDYRQQGLPHDLNLAGLRQYSLKNGHELYADAFVVALKGSTSQQAALRQWLGEPWETFFREVDLFDPVQPRMPPGSPAGGQFAPAGGSGAVTPPKLSYHAVQRMRERNKYAGVKDTMRLLAERPTPAGDWYVAMTRKARIDGYLVGTDGVVKTVLGPWYDPAKLRGMEVTLAEMTETSRLNVRRSVEWQLDNLTPAIATSFCRLVGIDPLTPHQLRTDWPDLAGYGEDDLEALLFARSEVEDAEPADA